MAETPAFDRVGEQFLAYYNTMRGHVRQEVTRQNLLPFIVEQGLSGNMIDVGGGNGRDIRWLFEVGANYNPTLVDPSFSMLQEAKLITPGLKIINTTAEELPKKRGQKEKHDLVLSHGVLMYNVDDPQSHVDAIAHVCKPKGLISLLTKGYAGTIDRLQREEKLDDLEKFMNDGLVTANLNETVRAFKFSELEDMLKKAGATVLNFSGVRIESDKDYRDWREVDYIERQRILANEYKLGKSKLMAHRGQMLHIIARKI